MSDQHADTGKVVIPKASPEGVVEAAHAVVGIGSAFAVRYAVEEVSLYEFIFSMVLCRILVT